MALLAGSARIVAYPCVNRIRRTNELISIVSYGHEAVNTTRIHWGTQAKTIAGYSLSSCSTWDESPHKSSISDDKDCNRCVGVTLLC